MISKNKISEWAFNLKKYFDARNYSRFVCNRKFSYFKNKQNSIFIFNYCKTIHTDRDKNFNESYLDNKKTLTDKDIQENLNQSQSVITDEEVQIITKSLDDIDIHDEYNKIDNERHSLDSKRMMKGSSMGKANGMGKEFPHGNDKI